MVELTVLPLFVEPAMIALHPASITHKQDDINRRVQRPHNAFVQLFANPRANTSIALLGTQSQGSARGISHIFGGPRTLRMAQTVSGHLNFSSSNLRTC